MGGNALSYTSVRLTKNNYDRVAADCLAKLKALYPEGRALAIEAYQDKADFGDLDLLISAEGYNPFTVAEALGALEVVRNGPVTSIGVRACPDVQELEGNVFQVDLISIDAPSFDFSAGYFSFNDLGNLVGRTAHSAGLSHKHNGLWFFVRDGDYKFREILLTRDYLEALSFLGYAPERYKQGFKTLEDIFWYVSTSKFFNRDIFLLENRNAKSRIRDRKRRTYMEYLKFCEEHPELPAFQYPQDKLAWLPRIAEHFPHFQGEYDQALADLAELREVKAKFNGAWVSELTSLQGKELGELMRHFKESFDSAEAQRAFVLSSTPDELKARVLAAQAELALVSPRSAGVSANG